MVNLRANLALELIMSDEQSKTQSKTKVADLSFEKAQAELESIVERMERSEQALERSLEDFERGVVLMKHCHHLLKDAEQKVEILVKDNNGLFTTEPFEPADS